VRRFSLRFCGSSQLPIGDLRTDAKENFHGHPNRFFENENGPVISEVGFILNINYTAGTERPRLMSILKHLRHLIIHN
jgi:hypothetical protein